MVGSTPIWGRLLLSRWWRARALELLVLALGLGLGGLAGFAVTGGFGRDGGDREPSRAAGPTAERTPRATRGRAPASRPAAAAPQEPRASAVVRRLARRLPLERQVAQLLLVGMGEGTDLVAPIFNDVAQNGWGGVRIDARNYLGIDQLATLGGELRFRAQNSGHPPPVVAAVQEGGAVRAFADLPPNVSQADVRSARQARAEAAAAAARLAPAGVTLALAPVADVTVGAGPLEARAFGDEAPRVAELTAAAAAGWRAGGVFPALKHFPGQGTASQDPLEGPSTVGLTREELRARDLLPFRRAAARAGAMVVSSAAFVAYDPVTPAALTPEIVRDLLRKEVRFRGVAISDDLGGITALTGGTVAQAAVAAVAAGIDMLQVADAREAEGIRRAVVAAVRGRRLSAARIRDALVRVLSLKERAGLLAPPG